MKYHNKSNLILLAIVCQAPLLNILFDYYLLHEKPTITSCIVAGITLSILVIFIVIHIKLFKD